MTNTHNRVIEHCSIVRRNGIAQTREKSTQMNCRNSTCSAEDFLARLLALPDTEKDLEILEEPYSLNLPDWLKPGSLAICCLKMCALPGFVDSKNEEKTERNAGYLVVSQSGGGMVRQGTRKGIRRTPANRGMRAHRVVKGLDISEDVCHGMCP